MEQYLKEYENCTLCPRNCGVNRRRGQVGFCGLTDSVKIARAALHYWEEPELSQDAGSGAIFFTGCNLRCIYCQNHDISSDNNGYEISVEQLAREYIRLQEEGALNINLVTAAMHVPRVIMALDMAKGLGLNIPVVYNSSGYESIKTLKMLEGYVDIYLPDLKYLNSALAEELSNVKDYPEVAMAALDEMYRQKKIMIVRHLVLPGHTKESMEVIKYLYETYGDDICISIMSQYTPIESLSDKFLKKNHSELTRRITKREYDKVVNYALELGIENAYIQERDVALESFIPDFYKKS